VNDRTDRLWKSTGKDPTGPSPSEGEGPQPETSPDDPNRKLAAGLEEIWERSEGVIFGRVEAIEAAAFALMGGPVSRELGLKAASEAYKLVGSLGTFGYPEGSRLARILEEAFLDEHLPQSMAPELSEALVKLRDELGKPPRLRRTGHASSAPGQE
jgi:hypothetical protein